MRAKNRKRHGRAAALAMALVMICSLAPAWPALAEESEPAAEAPAAETVETPAAETPAVETVEAPAAETAEAPAEIAEEPADEPALTAAEAAPAYEVSGRVNASSIPAGSGLVLLADTVLNMDVDRNFGYINCTEELIRGTHTDYTLEIRGEHALTIEEAICAKSITVNGADLTLLKGTLGCPEDVTLNDCTVQVPGGVSCAGNVVMNGCELSGKSIGSGGSEGRVITDSFVTLDGSIGGNGSTTITDSQILCTAVSNAGDVIIDGSTLRQPIDGFESAAIGGGGRVIITDSSLLDYELSCSSERIIRDSVLTDMRRIGGGMNTEIYGSWVEAWNISNSGEIIISDSTVDLSAASMATSCGGAITINAGSCVTAASYVSTGDPLVIENSEVEIAGYISTGDDITITGSDVRVLNNNVQNRSDYGIGSSGTLTLSDSSLSAYGSAAAIRMAGGFVLGANAVVRVPENGAVKSDTYTSASGSEMTFWSVWEREGVPASNVEIGGAFWFADVTDRSLFYYDPVYWAAREGITTGYNQPDGTVLFKPGAACTRVQVVTFLWRLAGSPEQDLTGEMPFSDMPSNRDFRQAIIWAANLGITTGWADGTFRPLEQCTRASIVTFLWRYAGKPTTLGTNPTSFTDMPSNPDFANAIRWAASYGITTGWPNGTFRPLNTCDRKSVVSFLYRFAHLRG